MPLGHGPYFFRRGFFSAMWSGKIAAEVIQKSLAQGKPSRRLFANYEKRVRKGADVLLACCGKLLHHAVHGTVCSLAPSRLHVLRGQRRVGRRTGRRLEFALAVEMTFSCSSNSKNAGRSCHTLLFAAPRTVIPKLLKTRRKLEILDRNSIVRVSRPTFILFALLLVFCAGCRTAQSAAVR